MGFFKRLKDNYNGLNGIRGYTLNPFIKSFICPNPKCLKSILMDKINFITCPHCDSTSESKLAFFLECPVCHSKIRHFNCPHCEELIDLDAPYNHKELEEKRNA